MLKLLNQAVTGRCVKALAALVFSLALLSCSDTDGPPQDLFGVAASGAAIQGSVYLVDADGVEISRAINLDGSFKFDVRQLTAPFMLKAVAANGVDPELFSFTEQTDAIINITPLTNAALFLANDNADPALLYDNWASTFGNITAADVRAAQAVMNANLHTQFTAFSLNPFVYDFFSTRFAANGTSIDGLLDAMIVDISSDLIELSVTGLGALAFDEFIDTTDYDIGGEIVAVAGNYTLKVNVSVAGSASTDVYLTVNFPAASLPTVDNAQIVEDMFKSFYGATGAIVINSTTVTNDAVTPTTTYAVVDTTITTADGDVSYIATYTFTQNL